jgi:CHAD domain-containing protein
MPKSISGRKFRRNVERVNIALRNYLEDPKDQDNIHEIRTAIRRLDSSFSLQPKKVRSRYKTVMHGYKDLLSANSKVRDCDIITGKLKAMDFSETAELQAIKKTELARAVRLASSLKELSPNMLDRPEEKRLNKVADRLFSKIKKALPSVLADSTKVDELHRLRRDFRRLRHVTDLVPSNSRKDYLRRLSKITGKDISLGEVQDLLGSIHDCDITIDYLRGIGAVQLMNRELLNRKKMYEEFTTYMKSRSESH